MSNLPFTLSLVLITAALPACTGDDGDALDARSELAALGASGVDGTVTFTLLAEGKVRIDADVTGLTPGMHGMHIHEWGDCSALDGMSAGGHFNPDGIDHGAPDAEVHHAGDFGNIEADADGHAVFTYTMDTATFSLADDSYSVLGRAIIIHEKPDTFGQPTGDAGGRLACGIIEAAEGVTQPVLPPAGA